VAGRWYHGVEFGVLAAGAVLVAATAVFVPMRIRHLLDVAGLGCRITTLAAGGNVQLALYQANQYSLLPTGTPLMVTASQVTDAAGVFAPTPTPAKVRIPPGLYWAAINADASAGGTVIMQVGGAAITNMGAIVGGAQASISSAAAAGNFYRKASLAFGSWPDANSFTTTEGVDQASFAPQFLAA
jgi:hypothetical protein